MDKIVLVIASRGVTWGEAVLGLLAALLLLLCALSLALWKGARRRALEGAEALERQREIEERMEALGRQQAEMTGRVQTIGEVFGTRQSDLARLLAERLDSLQHRVGDNLRDNVRQTVDNLAKLNERLAVIDAAQKNLSNLTGEVLSLKDVLSNKQARGAFGQGRMEAIIRDALPPTAYEFQPTLTNGKRPDCVIRLPGDDRPLVVDAKFPLEGFSALREARSDDMRKSAMQRVRADVGLHLKDIADKYLQPGETQDIAVLFVPSESIFADLQEHFEDVVQRAHRLRVLVVSPSLMMMAIQVMQAITRDARMREQAHQIQTEVQRLLGDLGRLRERVAKLDGHFRQAQDDVTQINVSADKIAKRGERIEAMDFQDAASAAREAMAPSPLMRGPAAAE